jgi:very-short-patch-repair endonuclease
VATDGVIARLARAQNGAVAWNQLIAAGLSPAQIRTRIARGQLHRLHRGVYAVSDPVLLPLACHSAALLSAGKRGLISHRTAALLWRLTERTDPAIDVTVIGASARPRGGLRLHRARSLDDRDVTGLHHLRLTTPARTVIDLAMDASTRELEHALAEARALRLITDGGLQSSLDRAPANHRGAARLKALLRTQTGRALTRSQRERLMLSLIAQAQLPRPLVNVKQQGFEVDLYWPRHRLVVEFDGYTTHGTRPAFERDRKRDQILAVSGIATMRVTDLQLRTEPVAVLTRISQAMAIRSDYT